MQANQIPPKFTIPWANNAGAGFVTYPVPTPSQQGIALGRASLTDGFPPATFGQPTGSGTSWPFGADENGILKWITLWEQWQTAYGWFPWDSAFSTAIGGYPIGAVVQSNAVFGLYFRSTIDNNTNNPDTPNAPWTPVTGWSPLVIAPVSSTNLNLYAEGGGTGNGLSSSTPAGSILDLLQLIGEMTDAGDQSIIINTLGGTINEQIDIYNPVRGGPGATFPYAGLVINGQVATTLTGGAASFGTITVGNNAVVHLQGALTIQSASGGALNCYLGARVSVGAGVIFGTCAQNMIYLDEGCALRFIGNFSIAGNAATFCFVDSGSVLNIPASGVTATLVGTPAFSTATVLANNGGVVKNLDNIAWAGSGATGSRFSVLTGGKVLNTASLTFIPGNASGTVDGVTAASVPTFGSQGSLYT